MTQLNPGPLDAEAVQKIYRLILHESIRIQEDHGLGNANLHGERRPRAPRKRRKAAVA